MPDQPSESLVQSTHDPLIDFLNKFVILSVKLLAIFMVIVIWWALADVVIHISEQIIFSKTPFNVDRLIYILGDFLAVLIAIEIFMNIVFYLKKDAIHVPLVLSTALTAVARKVIIIDYANASPMIVFATASVIAAVGITYWLVTRKE